MRRTKKGQICFIDVVFRDWRTDLLKNSVFRTKNLPCVWMRGVNSRKSQFYRNTDCLLVEMRLNNRHWGQENGNSSSFCWQIIFIIDFVNTSFPHTNQSLNKKTRTKNQHKVTIKTWNRRKPSFSATLPLAVWLF